MAWYHLFTPATDKWLTLIIFVVCFGLILYRNVKIAYVSLGAAALLIALGIMAPDAAFIGKVDWDVLAIFIGDTGCSPSCFGRAKCPRSSPSMS